MSRNKIEKFIEKALDKMFQAVGFEKSDKQFMEQQDWFTHRTWTEEQEQKYKTWFIKQWKREFKSNDYDAEKNFSWFNLMWGWKSAK
jgi:hypothetical protein